MYRLKLKPGGCAIRLNKRYVGGRSVFEAYKSVLELILSEMLSIFRPAC